MLSASHIFLSSAVASLLKEPSIIGGPSIEKCRPIVSNLWQERAGERGMQPHIKPEERIRMLLIFHGIYSRLTLCFQFNFDNEGSLLENTQYEATYRLSRRSSIVGGVDADNKRYLSYRIKYYY